MKKVLGIDVGGTNVKFGLVDEKGNLSEKYKHPTANLVADGKCVHNFITVLKEQLKKFPEVKKVGIGIPGLISKDRNSIVFAPNIPDLTVIELITLLKKEFPGKVFSMDNDANAAALGEYKFAKEEVEDNLLMITLGTGVGGGAIIDGKIFKGGRGNSLEIGHIYGGKGNSIEEEIGKKGIVKKAKKLLSDYPNSVLNSKKNLDAKKVAKAALAGDPVGIKVFEHVGKYLGQCIVGGVRILDIHTIVIGGGVSETFDIVETSMMKVINDKLGPYYTDDLIIKKASLGNEAGILGAASLMM